MKKESLFNFVAVLLVLFSITSVNADTIPGLFNTGVDNNGNLSNIGSSDLHYTVNGQRPFIVTADSAWNDPLGSPSIWVSISSNTWDSKGEYTYIINFDLSGYDHNTANIEGQLMSDDQVDVIINDTVIVEDLGGFTSWKPFSITTGFKSGINTLKFNVTNTYLLNSSQTGLRVEFFSGTAFLLNNWGCDLDDVMHPTGAIHAQDNVFWNPNDLFVGVGLNGYVLDELSIARDGSGTGISSAHIVVNTVPETTIILKDKVENLLDTEGKFSVNLNVPAVKDAVYNVSLYASDSNPVDAGGPNNGLVDSTEIHLPLCTAIDVDNDGYSVEMGDCNDNEPAINPGAIEVCDGIDNNCNGLIDEGFDMDGDDFSQCDGDCNDNDPSINPVAVELPGNEIDENCDGSLGSCDPNASWKNHGEYVRCVAHEIEELVDAGIISQEEGDLLINSAAQSDIGKK